MLILQRFLFDVLPLALFFIAYRIYGMMVATKVIMLCAVLQMAYLIINIKTTKKSAFLSSIMILAFGSATLFFNNEMFVKAKPTVLYWLFAVLFVFSQIALKKPFIQSLGQEVIKLDQDKWRKLNMSWAMFFMFMGTLNLYVILNYDSQTWVNFKFFGTLALTSSFVILQSIYISKSQTPVPSTDT